MTLFDQPSRPLLSAMSLASLLALSTGIGFGTALHSESAAPAQAGLFQSDQSFPSQLNWPIFQNYPQSAEENAGEARYNSLQNQ